MFKHWFNILGIVLVVITNVSINYYIHTCEHSVTEEVLPTDCCITQNTSSCGVENTCCIEESQSIYIDADYSIQKSNINLLQVVLPVKQSFQKKIEDLSYSNDFTCHLLALPPPKNSIQSLFCNFLFYG